MSSIKVSQKEKIGISIAGLILLLAVVDRLIYAPINETLEKLNRETQITEKKLIYSLNNLSQKEFITNEYQKYGLEIKENSSDDEKTASMLSEIERLAKKSGASLVDIKPQPTRNIDFYEELIVEVNVQGSMEDLVKFLHYLHDSPLLLRTQNLHLDLKDKNSPTVEALIKVTKISI